MGPLGQTQRWRNTRLTCGTRWQADGAAALAWAQGERGFGPGEWHCWLGRLGLDEGEAGPVQGKGEGRGGRAGLGRGKGWAGLGRFELKG